MYYYQTLSDHFALRGRQKGQPLENRSTYLDRGTFFNSGFEGMIHTFEKRRGVTSQYLLPFLQHVFEENFISHIYVYFFKTS